MSNITVQQVKPNDKTTAPEFQELVKRFEAVRRRAFELFEGRGRQPGYDLDDWFAAERELLGEPLPDFKDEGDRYKLVVPLPGFDAKDIKVMTAADEIVVHAASQQTRKGGADAGQWKETASSELYRRVPAPGAADLGKAIAKLDNGILSITLPKAAKPQEKSFLARAG